MQRIYQTWNITHLHNTKQQNRSIWFSSYVTKCFGSIQIRENGMLGKQLVPLKHRSFSWTNVRTGISKRKLLDFHWIGAPATKCQQWLEALLVIGNDSGLCHGNGQSHIEGKDLADIGICFFATRQSNRTPTYTSSAAASIDMVEHSRFRTRCISGCVLKKKKVFVSGVGQIILPNDENPNRLGCYRVPDVF